MEGGCVICSRMVWPYQVWECDNCVAFWCNHCNEHGSMTKFNYNGKSFCSLCFSGPFECQECPKGVCPSSKCEKIGWEYNHSGMDYKGLCCKSWIYEKPCPVCAIWEVQQICTILIGLRKFRKRNLLSTLPRDVLIYALVKPFVWEERGKKDIFKNLKKLKTK